MAAIGAVMLLVSLFLDWFKPSLSAWTTFEIVDLLLAGIALAVLYACFEHFRGVAATSAGGRTGTPWAAPAAGLALIIVVATLLNHPPAAIGLGVKVGIWIALAGALLMTAGALIDRAGVSFSFSVARPDAADPPTQQAPETNPSDGHTETRPISER